MAGQRNVLEKFTVMANVKIGGHILGLASNPYFVFLFRGYQTIFSWSRKFNISPWKFKVKIMAKVKMDGQIWGLVFNAYISFLFQGNETIFPLDIAISIFDLENSNFFKSC